MASMSSRAKACTGISSKFGAGEGTRTLDPNLGKLALYLLAGCVGAREQITSQAVRPPTDKACEAISFTICSHFAAVESVLPKRALWPIRSSSRKNRARPKTSASPWVLGTEKSSRPRVICSSCSNPRMSCRPGSGGRLTQRVHFRRRQKNIWGRSKKGTPQGQSLDQQDWITNHSRVPTSLCEITNERMASSLQAMARYAA
jgi:hypothetical protein